MAETQTSDVVIPSGDTTAQHPHAKPANGAGGSLGTHGGHADGVPTIGLGMVGADEQSAGNSASKQYTAEHGAGRS